MTPPIVHRYGILVPYWWQGTNRLKVGPVTVNFLRIMTREDAYRCAGMEFCQLLLGEYASPDAQLYMQSRIRIPQSHRDGDGNPLCPTLTLDKYP